MESNKNNVILKIARDRYIESSKEVALVKLDSIRFTVGQEFMVNYYTDSTRTTIDTVVAIGIKDGIGRGNYKIESIGEKNYVWGVVTELPDISSLVHGEIYLYNDIDNKRWFLVYSSDGVYRTVTPISSTPKTYFNLADNNFWVSNTDKKVWCLNDICTVDQVYDIIKKYDGGGGDTIIKEFVGFDTLTEEQIAMITGPAGYTPIRGVDYWTSSDQMAINNHIETTVENKLSWQELRSN